MPYSDWDSTNNPHFKCKKCGNDDLHYRTYEDSEGHEDYEYQCQTCKHRWWVDGMDY